MYKSVLKAKWFHKRRLELILMHLLLEMNGWHFKNSLCLQFTVKFKPHHQFQRWQWDSSAAVFLGWLTPALIQAWMMSSIHYTMIKSLSPTCLPESHHCEGADIHQGPILALLAKRWVLGGWGKERTSLPCSQAVPESEAWWVKTQWPVRQPVTHNGPDAAGAEKRPKFEETKTVTSTN